MTAFADLIHDWRRDLRRPDRGTSHPRRTVVLIGCVLAFTLLGVASWLVLDRRAADLAAADHETAALAVALAEQTSLTFGAVDSVLREILLRIRVAGIASPQALVERTGTPELQHRLHDQIAGLSQIDVVAVIGADGQMINSSREWPVHKSVFTDRDFFPALRGDPSLGAMISAPAKSQTTGRLLIVLSRRISAPDGRFLGIVVGAIRLDYFADLYRSVSAGEGRLVALRRRDGTLLARYPETDQPLGVLPGGDELVQGILQGAQTARSLSRSPVDGTLRLRTVQVVKDFPLVVVVARTAASILAEWRRQSVIIGSGAVLGALTLLMTTAVLARQIARREDSEAALAATLDNVTQGIIMIGPDRHIPVYNRRALEMLDIPPELMASQPLFDDILRFQWGRGEFGPAGADLDDAMRQFIVSGGLSAEVHSYERRRPDGTILEISSIPLASGGVVRTYTDVTAMRVREAVLQDALHERDVAEEALRERGYDLEREVADRTQSLAASESRHRDVAEVASDWFWEIDTEHRLTFVSQRFGEMSGIPWAPVVGGGFSDLAALGFDPAGMDELRATIDAHGVFHDAIHRVRLADGAVRFWRLSGKPFADPTTRVFAGYRGTGTDVTVAMGREAALNAAVLRAEAAEREARQARVRLVDAIETIPEGFVLHDADDRLVLCNARYGEIYGLSNELMTPGGRFEDLLRATAGRGDYLLDGVGTEQWIAERLIRHRAGSGSRSEQCLANGRWLQLDERRTSDGGTVGIRIDVTEARQREAVEREREKLAALGQLAGGVAHEINNLLQPAITLPEMVRDRLPIDDLESREDLDCVMDGARKVRDIVRNILLYARKEEPRLVLLDLAGELRAAIGFVRDLMPPSISVREENLEAHLGCRVAANKTQLTQVLTNLLVNAAQATKGTGTVTVSVASTEPTADEAGGLAIEPGRAYLAVSVADTGSGMDEATQKHIFEPFFTTKPVGQGTGLGLSVAYGILRSWGGAITVRSALGQGTTFVLHIPLVSVAGA